MFTLALLLWLTLPVLSALAWADIWQFTVGWSTSRPTIVGLVVNERGGVMIQYRPSARTDYGLNTSERLQLPGIWANIWPLASGRTAWAGEVQIWAIQLALLPLPSGAYFYRRQTKEQVHRMREGHCVHCGYDLRSSGDRCPECGTPRDDAPALAGSAA